jgi:hypothetical protein
LGNSVNIELCAVTTSVENDICWLPFAAVEHVDGARNHGRQFADFWGDRADAFRGCLSSLSRVGLENISNNKLKLERKRTLTDISNNWVELRRKAIEDSLHRATVTVITLLCGKRDCDSRGGESTESEELGEGYHFKRVKTKECEWVKSVYVRGAKR